MTLWARWAHSGWVAPKCGEKFRPGIMTPLQTGHSPCGTARFPETRLPRPGRSKQAPPGPPLQRRLVAAAADARPRSMVAI
jgi:hypothetical protein